MTAAVFLAAGLVLGVLIGAVAVWRQCASDARIATDTRAAFIDDEAEFADETGVLL